MKKAIQQLAKFANYLFNPSPKTIAGWTEEQWGMATMAANMDDVTWSAMQFLAHLDYEQIVHAAWLGGWVPSKETQEECEDRLEYIFEFCKKWMKKNKYGIYPFRNPEPKALKILRKHHFIHCVDPMTETGYKIEIPVGLLGDYEEMKERYSKETKL